METDILTPKERYYGVVFIGVRRNGVVEFIKVYAENELTAKTVLEEFLYAKGIHPADFVVVERGYENVEGKEIISTRTETELSSSLARLGLRLLSNGILYLQGKKEIYQITSVSKELLEKIRAMKEEIKRTELEEKPITFDFSEVKLPPRYTEKLKALELMEDTLIINHADISLHEVLRKSVRGSVNLPKWVRAKDIMVKIFDDEFHNVIAERNGEVLITPPIVVWDSHTGSLEEFEVQEIDENMYNAPLFLKAYKGFLVLQEPPDELVERLLTVKEKGVLRVKGKKISVPMKFVIIIETKAPEKYEKLVFPVKIKLSPLTQDEVNAILEENLGFSIPKELFSDLPLHYRTFKGISALMGVFKKLQDMEPNKEPLGLLKKALVLFLGEENESD